MFLRGHALLRRMIVLTSSVGAFLAFAQATLVLFVLETLKVPDFGFGIITALIGVGALAGALVASSLVARFGRGRVMLAGTLFGGLGLLGAGVAPTVFIVVPLYMISSFGISIWNVPWGALRQDIVPGHLLGRMIGMIRTLTWGIMPVAAILGGLVGRVDLRLPFIVGGALTVIASLLATRLLLSVDRYSTVNVSGAA